jgi:hypothetical protein
MEKAVRNPFSPLNLRLFSQKPNFWESLHEPVSKLEILQQPYIPHAAGVPDFGAGSLKQSAVILPAGLVRQFNRPVQSFRNNFSISRIIEWDNSEPAFAPLPASPFRVFLTVSPTGNG